MLDKYYNNYYNTAKGIIYYGKKNNGDSINYTHTNYGGEWYERTSY